MHAKPAVDEFEDRRADSRVDLHGHYSVRVDPSDGREPLTCPVVDFSVTGVRVSISEETVLPERVQIVMGEISHNARVVWRKDNVAGIDLVDEHHSLY